MNLMTLMLGFHPMKCLVLTYYCVDRVIDVGSEWRTFNNEKSTKDNSRVGAAEVLTLLFYHIIYS